MRQKSEKRRGECITNLCQKKPIKQTRCPHHIARNGLEYEQAIEMIYQLVFTCLNLFHIYLSPYCFVTAQIYKKIYIYIFTWLTHVL